MNIKLLNKDIKILQKGPSISVYGGGATAGKYVYISSSLTKVSQNNYKVTVSLSCSSGYVFNGYGMKVYAVIGGTVHHLGTPTISDGVFSVSSFSKTFSVSSNTSVYAKCICSYCESGAHNEDYDKFKNESAADTAVYVNPSIIPNAPNPTIVWKNTNSFLCNGYTCYKSTTDEASTIMNSTTFNCALPANSNKVHLYIEKYVTPNWVNIKTHTITGANQPYIHTYKTTDRGFIFRIRSVSVSSTNNQTAGVNVGWSLNDLPIMNASSIKFNTSKTSDSVVLSWDHLTDQLNNADKNKSYKINLYKNTSNGYVFQKNFTVNTNTTSFNLSDHGYEKGEQCKATIEPKDCIEWAGVAYGSAEVVRNSAPYFSSGSIVNSNCDSEIYNKTFNNSIDVSWNSAIDNQGDALTYNVYYKAQDANNNFSPDYVYINNTTGNSITLNCQNYVARGKSIIIYVEASDGLAISEKIKSYTLTRNDNPPAPTNITIDPNTSDEHYELIRSVSWTKSVGVNGQDCSSYKIDVIINKTKSTTNPVSINSYTTTGTSLDVSIVNVERGYYIIFRVKAIDMYGLESEYLDSKWCRKNKAPNSPKGFKVNASKLNFYNTVPLKWDAASDPDGDNITYRIFHSLNGSGDYKKIIEGLTTLTYTHDISNRAPGDTLGYKIVSVDKHGIASSETTIENNHNIVVNTKPEAPLLMYPLSLIYDRSPRLLLQTNGDMNNDTLNIKININGQDFNSATSSNFDKASYSSMGDKIAFKCPNLNIGKNTIKLIAYDGYQNSNERIVEVEYKEPLLRSIEVNQDVFISSQVYSSFTKMIGDTRKAYSYGVFNPTQPTSGETKITSTTFNTLYDTIYEITEWINTNYPGENKIKNKPNIITGSFVTKLIYNSILEIITNI